MQKIIDILKIAIILTVILCGCSYSHLHHSKYYVVESLEVNTASFKGIKGIYLMDTKDLKIGQKIHIKKVWNKKKANVTIINH